MCVCGGGGGVVPLSVSYSASLVFYEAHEYASWRMRCELCEYELPKYADHPQTILPKKRYPSMQAILRPKGMALKIRANSPTHSRDLSPVLQLLDFKAMNLILCTYHMGKRWK